MKLLSLLMVVITAALSLRPCCDIMPQDSVLSSCAEADCHEADDCCNDETADTDGSCGTCSPFFSCGSCAGFTVHEPVSELQSPQCIIVKSNILYTETDIQSDYINTSWQPPEICTVHIS